jgi:hypothetical protein
MIVSLKWYTLLSNMRKQEAALWLDSKSNNPMAESRFCCFGTRDSAIPRTPSDQNYVLQDMFNVDYISGREGYEDFVTKCNNEGIVIVHIAKSGSIADAWRVCSMGCCCPQCPSNASRLCNAWAFLHGT